MTTKKSPPTPAPPAPTFLHFAPMPPLALMSVEDLRREFARVRAATGAEVICFRSVK
jgi:hypothetical protein